MNSSASPLRGWIATRKNRGLRRADRYGHQRDGVHRGEVAKNASQAADATVRAETSLHEGNQIMSKP